MKAIKILFALPIALILLACGPYGPSFTFQSVDGMEIGKNTFKDVEEKFKFEELSLKREFQQLEKPGEYRETKLMEVKNVGVVFVSEDLKLADDPTNPKIDKIRLTNEFFGYGPVMVWMGLTDLKMITEALGEPDQVDEHTATYTKKGVKFIFKTLDDERVVLDGMELNGTES